MIYSREIVDQYRNHPNAITDVSQIVPGMTVWSNYTKSGKKVIGLFTESHIATENVLPLIPGNGKLEWLWFTDHTSISLTDNNVGNSYNPWMLFTDEGTMKEYHDKISPTMDYSIDEYYSYADDFVVDDYDIIDEDYA